MSRFGWPSLRQRTFGSQSTKGKSRKKGRLRRENKRLRLEMLEDRRMLATFTVTNLNDAGAGSLRQAIVDANSTGGADDIVFQAGLTGTIALTSGEMSITESVTITGNGATSSVIDAQQGSRIFNISGGDVTLTGLTLTNGRVDSGFAVGGAILFASTGTLAVNQSVLSDNFTTNSGGAIYGTDGPVMVSGSTLSGNSATIVGGAISSDEPLIVTDSTLSQNSASLGGAISAGFVVVRRSTLTENTAQINGGAIEAGEVTAEESTFSMNSADVDGGAISVSGQAAIAQATFSLNSAERGGAIFAMAGPVDVLQSTLRDNSSTSAMTLLSGNAIFSESAPLTILNSIVDSFSIGSRSDVQPSPDAGDAFVVEYSLIGKNIGTSLTPTGPTTPDANGNLIGDSNGISSDTGDLAVYGGPTMTIRLLPSSPALNRGSNSIASLFTQDQRGEPFARVFGGTVDMGAFELQDLALVVDTNVDEDDGDYSTGDLSLREAIRLTSANPGADTITFAPSTNGTDFDLTLGVMTISDTLTITGNGAADTVIDAQQSSAIFAVTSPPMIEPDLTVEGLSLLNGVSTGSHSAIGSLSSGTLTLSDIVASGNTGGAVGHRGTLNVTRSTFAGNSGAYPGGQNSGAAISAVGPITVTESTLSGNTDGTFGGAISGATGEVMVIQSTITGNSGAQGGGIYGGPGAITVIQSTIANNTAIGVAPIFPALGGGIYSDSAPVTIRNSIVAANTDGGMAPDVSPSPDAGDAFVVEYSLIGNNTGTGLMATGATTPDANGNLIGDAAGIDPLLAALADNGGPTETRALLPGSPAYNHGSNAIAAPFMFDQRGTPFDRVLAGTVDMGAVEAPAPTFQIIDDGDPAPAFMQSGDLGIPWTNQGYQGDVREMISDGKFVTYTFTGLNPGDIYDVSATWTEFLNRETQSPYTIDGATTGPVTVLIDQTLAPNDFSDGTSWERLGTFEVGSGGNLVVTLAGTPNRRSVIADAVRIDLRTDAEIAVTVSGDNIESGVGSVDIGSGIIGETVTKELTVHNIGAADLILAPLTLPSGSDFEIVQSYLPGSTIMPGQSATFIIGLKTESTGAKSDVLTFGTNDANENPFSIALTGRVGTTVAIIDDGDPVGYSATGNPTRWTQQGFIGTDGVSDVHEAVAGGTAQSATYTFPGLPAGTYRISATWTPFYNRATNVPYTINGGASILVNQRLSPSSTSSTPAGSVLQDPGSGIYFADLDGAFSFAGGTLTVQVSDSGANGNVIIDAVRIERLSTPAPTLIAPSSGTPTLLATTQEPAAQLNVLLDDAEAFDDLAAALLPTAENADDEDLGVLLSLEETDLDATDEFFAELGADA